MLPTRITTAVVTALLLGAGPLWAQDSDREVELQEIEAAMEATQERADRLAARQAALARESQALSEELAQVAAETARWEDEVIQVELTLEALVQESEARREDLAGARDRLSILTGALLRISLLPPEALVARPGAPTETVRAGLLMRRLMPQLEAQAASLRHEVADLKSLEMQIEAENADALAARRKLQSEEERLQDLLDRRTALLAVTEEERQQAEAEAETLAASAKDIRGLLTSAPRRVGLGPPVVPPVPPKERQVALLADGQLDSTYVPPALPADPPAASTAAPSSTPSVTQSAAATRNLRKLPREPGGLTLPVKGEVVGTFKEASGDRLGMRIAGRPGGTVVAAYDGVIVYAGNFRSYGLVLILDHGEGYHSVLAELGRIDALLGQRVLAGEPVGTLSQGSAEPPQLYVELRRNGRPIDPGPWFAPAKE